MLLLLVPQTWYHNNICCDPSLIPSMEIIRLNFSPHPNRRSSTHTISIPVMKTLAQLNIILDQNQKRKRLSLLRNRWWIPENYPSPTHQSQLLENFLKGNCLIQFHCLCTRRMNTYILCFYKIIMELI